MATQKKTGKKTPKKQQDQELPVLSKKEQNLLIGAGVGGLIGLGITRHPLGGLFCAAVGVFTASLVNKYDSMGKENEIPA